MQIPVIRGTIDRRILVNYRIDPTVVQRQLPAPFRPQLVNGYAVGGICLIRLRGIRPRFLPVPCGLSSENAAHRIAVQWDVDGQTQHGVYIPRRDTNSRLNQWVGGRLFPGIHHAASFDAEELDDCYSVSVASDDGETRIQISGRVTDALPSGSVFESLEQTSQFFQAGAVGYSPAMKSDQFEGIELKCARWNIEALEVERVASSYFDDQSRFPNGSIQFDCALLMRDIDHLWLAHEDMCCEAPRAL